MKVTPVKPKPLPAPVPVPERRPTPRVAAVRRIAPDRPLRVWSLLLPPNFDSK
jgi:hypothetical protein